MLDVDLGRPVATPREAATLVLLRDAMPSGVEVFCVERHKKSGFMGGAVVFPGGKVDEADRDDAFRAQAQGDDVVAPSLLPFAVAACREALEEAALLLVVGEAPSHDDALALRALLATGAVGLRRALEDRGLRLDLGGLTPFARWITPAVEPKRFDTYFFVAEAPAGQRGDHDRHETTASFWARPGDILARYARHELELVPPTYHALVLFSPLERAAQARELARTRSLDPVCPVLVPHTDARGSTLALVLPGDPEHSERTRIAAGPSRFVLRDGLWLPEDAPPSGDAELRKDPTVPHGTHEPR